MATIAKRKYWADPVTGKEVKAGTPGAVQKESKFYRIRYTDAAGRRLSAKGYSELRPTEQLAAKLEAAAARGEEGLVNPFEKHNRRPLTEHVDDYLADLAMKGRSPGYIEVLKPRLKRVIRECAWTRLRDITAPAFIEWQRKQFAQGDVNGKTLNDWRDALRSFLNWCASKNQGRISGNPIAGVETLPSEPTFVRKAIQTEELEALYLAAPQGRARAYAFAVNTGLRRQEMELLQWGDVVLDAPRAFLRLRDYTTKARRADTFALKLEVAEMLRAVRPKAWVETDLVFPLGVPSAQQLREDLAAAGVELPADDDLDRIDFHALRTTLGSFIGRSGIPERVGMELLRVTEPRLLRQTYCDPRVLQTAAAVDRVEIPVPVSSSSNSPGQIRTGAEVRDGPRLTCESGAIGVVESGKGLCFGELTGELSGAVRECPDVLKLTALGIEPSSNPLQIQGKSRFVLFPGPNSDRGGSGGASEGVAGPTDRLLSALVELWPRLPLTVRTSLLSLATAAAGAIQEKAARGGVA